MSNPTEDELRAWFRKFGPPPLEPSLQLRREEFLAKMRRTHWRSRVWVVEAVALLVLVLVGVSLARRGHPSVTRSYKPPRITQPVSRPGAQTCPSFAGASIPVNDSQTMTGGLQVVNQFIQAHTTGASTYTPLQLNNVRSAPASQSAYASLIDHRCGRVAVRDSWWVAVGQPGVPFSQFAQKHPALVENYYLIERGNQWRIWWHYP